MSWLLDTNILSELRKPKPERKVVEFIASVSIQQLYGALPIFDRRLPIDGSTGLLPGFRRQGLLDSLRIVGDDCQVGAHRALRAAPPLLPFLK
jgi:hypothetical protein